MYRDMHISVFTLNSIYKYTDTFTFNIEEKIGIGILFGKIHHLTILLHNTQFHQHSRIVLSAIGLHFYLINEKQHITSCYSKNIFIK